MGVLLEAALALSRCFGFGASLAGQLCLLGRRGDTQVAA